jgi:hypothetical protein
MSFNDVGYVDARHSTFSQVGRDYNQTTIHNRHYHISIFPFCSRRRPHHIAIDFGDNLSQTTFRPDSLTPGSHHIQVVMHPLSDGISDIIDPATSLVEQITHFLLGRRRSTNNRQDLTLELESLYQTLTLIKLTIQKYNDTPLGQSLVNVITPEIKLCSTTLQKLLNSFNDTRLDLSITTVGGLLRRIWWSEWDGHEFASLRKKLLSSRYSLLSLLIALHSYVLFFVHLANS